MKIFVKNMACESCKIVAKDVLDEMGIQTIKVVLGEIGNYSAITPKGCKIQSVGRFPTD